MPFIFNDYDVYNAISCFPNESSGRPDCVSPHVLKDLVAKINREAGLNFLKLLEDLLVNLLMSGEFPNKTKVFFGAKLIAPI